MSQSVSHGSGAVNPALLFGFNAERKKELLRYALVAPAVIWIAVFVGFPLGRVFVMSIWENGFTAKHYIEVFQDPTFYRVLWVTIKISTLTTVLCLLLGYPLAHLIATSSTRVGNFLSTIVMVAFWTSLLVRTYAWMVILGQRGLINQMLMHFGVISEPLPLMYNLTGVLVGMVHVLLPFMIFSLVGVMKGIDVDLVGAAKSMGASDFRAFVHVYLPLSRPGISSGCLIVFMMSLGYFVTPALLGGRHEMMLGQLIELYVSEILNWGYASALSIVLFAGVVAIFAIYQRIAPSEAQWRR